MFRAGGFELTPTCKVDAACGRVGVAAVARAEGCIGDAKKGANDMLEVVAHCREYINVASYLRTITAAVSFILFGVLSGTPGVWCRGLDFACGSKEGDQINTI